MKKDVFILTSKSIDLSSLLFVCGLRKMYNFFIEIKFIYLENKRLSEKFNIKQHIVWILTKSATNPGNKGDKW